MFYSTEILTSRKYGVATVWLVATMGSKSTLKKISRKAILDVDVQKACDTIVAPEAPMALRLQSNLLFGVARVYSQQCNFILHDAQQAQNGMRALLKAMNTTGLEVEGGNKGRKDQILLTDDPNFLPDLDLVPMDVDQIDFNNVTGDDSQHSNLSPHSSQLTVSSLRDIDGLMIPGSVSSFIGGPMGGLRGLGDSGPGSRNEHHGFLDDDLGILIEPDGTMRMSEGPVRQPRGPLAPSDRLGSADSRVRRDHDAARFGDDIFGQQDEDGFVPLYDDEFALGEQGEAFPYRRDPSEQVIHSTSTETASTHLRPRRKAAPRTLAVDTTMELRNGDLARWNTEYLANMNEAIRIAESRKSSTIAKKNAEHWVLGGLMRQFGESDQGPLSMFSSRGLLEAFGALKTKNKNKRARDDINEDDTDRRVRSRTDDEIARGLDDDGFLALMDEDTIEQGREAPTPLDERHLSSAFPWNQSTDSHRPPVLYSVGPGAVTSSMGGGAGIPFGPMSRRGSRLVSASPLHGRGEPMDLDTQQIINSDEAHALSGATADEAYELFGPAANVDTQTAAQSQWQRRILDGESINFLAFVKAGIEQADVEREQAMPGDEGDDVLLGSVEFEALLEPGRNTCIVAAQAFLHVLALGTKGMLEVEQEEEYGAILMRVIGE